MYSTILKECLIIVISIYYIVVGMKKDKNIVLKRGFISFILFDHLVNFQINIRNLNNLLIFVDI